MPAERLFLKRRLKAARLGAKERLGLANDTSDGLSWLFVATLPNAGSTALAQLLLTGSRVTTLEENGEGQWLTFDARQPSKRWKSRARINYGAMRTLWLDRLSDRKSRRMLVIEKSPPNLVRMRRVLETFDDMPTRLIRLTRDPYAVCASWAKRYGPSRVAEDWGEPTGEMVWGSREFFTALGRIYGERLKRLAELKRRSSFDLRYEDLTADPVSALEPLKQSEPLLADIDASAKLAVKDYEPRPLENMNERQIGKLTSAQIAGISAGLQPFAEHLPAFGYELR